MCLAKPPADVPEPAKAAKSKADPKSAAKVSEPAKPEPARPKPAELFPAKPFDVEVRGIVARDLGVWVARIHCGGFKEAEEAALALLGEPIAGRRYNSVVVRSTPEIQRAVARAGGFAAWFDAAGNEYQAVVAQDWRELVGHPPDHQVGADHDRLRLHPELGLKSLEWERTPILDLVRFGISGDALEACVTDEIANAGQAWDVIESGHIAARSGMNWDPDKVRSLEASVLALREWCGDLPAHVRPIEPAASADEPMVLWDVIAVKTGPNADADLWVGRVEASDAEEAEDFLEQLVSSPDSPVVVEARREDDDFDVSVERAGGFRDHTVFRRGTPFGGTTRDVKIRAALARDAREILHPTRPPEPAEKLDTDTLLLFAANLRSGMAERWEQIQRDGAGDAEIRAALGRAFGLGEMELDGLGKVRAGSHSVPGGCCSFVGGDAPKFWAGKTNWQGRPTLESKALVDRARRVLEIPGEDGEAPPAKPAGKGGRRPRASAATA